MRTVTRIGLALLLALGLSTPVFAQSSDDRISFNASVGPSFANLGTTVATNAGLDVKLNDYISLMAEAGFLPRTSFDDATEIAPPPGFQVGGRRHVSAVHWNGNVRVRPFDTQNVIPYLTAGLGSFTADTIGQSRLVDGVWIQDRSRATDFSTNVGAGIQYRMNDWVGLGADYRTFFVHRDNDTPKVHRFTAGLALFLK